MLGSGGTGTVGCGLAGPLDGPVPGNAGMPSASAWCVPVGVRRLRACAPLSKRPGSPSLVSVFPPSRCRITTGYTCDKYSAHFSSIATQHVDNSPVSAHAQARLALFPVKRPTPGAARQRNPQHFHRVYTGSVLFRTSHPHLCAQPAGKQSSCRGGRQQPISPPMLAVTPPAGRARDSGPGADEIVQNPGRGCSPPRWPGCRRPRCLLPPVAARPRGGLACAPGRDPGHRGRHSGGCRRAGPGRRRSGRAELRKAPHV